jgi:D-3-phosphoglycerate dehydrogenase
VDATAGASALEAALPDAWALIVRSRTKVDARLLGKAPKLELIARAGVGVDNVDMAAAGARHIRVVNAPSAATTSVAELTIALALLLVRGFLPSAAATKAGRWERGTHGGELAGRTVGMVGYGRIAREVARRLTPFDVHLVAYDPYVTASGDTTTMVDLPTLFARADVISLHAASTRENHHLLNAGAFASMKTGVYLINVARGNLVDEAALLDVLRSGKVAGAALDVFESEPPTNRALLELPNVIATPHIGASTPEGQARAGAFVVEEVLRAVKGLPLTALVAPPGGSA